jgi:hypothetical protein
MGIRVTHQAEWAADCLRWRGRLLTGKFSHWCWDWDGLPVDETCPEWPDSCTCSVVRGETEHN